MLQVIEAAERVTGLEVPRRLGTRRSGDPATLVASSGKAERLLGWERLHPGIETIIRDAFEWRKAHPEGYGG